MGQTADGRAVGGEPQKSLLISRDEIRGRVQELARRISADYAGQEPVLIGVLNGVVFFFADLVRELSIPARLDFLRAASYGSRTESSGSIRLTKQVEIPIAGEPVIVVEDIVDTGLTLKRILEVLQEGKPASLRVCALIDKRERRDVEVPIDYCGFCIPGGFIVGYGLDYDERYRHLPDLYVLEQGGAPRKEASER